MSRLDDFVHRVTAQLAFINEATRLLDGVDGVVFEVGLGNGRTFNHLRNAFSDREIYVFDRTARAHADSTPDPEFMIEGQLIETLPEQVERFAGRVALIHSDIGNQSEKHCDNMKKLLSRTIAPALCPGGILLSDLELDIPTLTNMDQPANIGPGWYHAYRLPA
ncbi:MAG: class I SAM-dependent methyltransferase [Hyphomicrobiaceae bacterium]